MAGVEKIKERILEEARSQAESNIKRAQEEGSDIIASAKKDGDSKKAVILEKAKKEAQEVKKRLKSVAELEARKKKLQAKQEMVEEAFKKTLEKLIGLPDEEYEKIISQMLLNSVESGSEEIILSPRDKKRLSPNFVEEINKKLVAKGIKGSLSLSKESRDINGGFVLKSGDIETNSSFEALIRAKREEIEPEVVKVLF
jgi:V/A-type H+-transporting ATPase subunit E